MLIGDRCCIDLMGSTKFYSSRPNWEKICCSNPRGAYVHPPKDISATDVAKLDNQLRRMPSLVAVRLCFTNFSMLVGPFLQILTRA